MCKRIRILMLEDNMDDVEIIQRQLLHGGVDCEFKLALSRNVCKASDQLKQQMRNLTDRRLMATSSAGMGVWEWNIEKNELQLDEGMRRLYKISDDTSYRPMKHGYRDFIQEPLRMVLQNLWTWSASYR